MQVHRSIAARGPLARYENLVVTETADEVLLYDSAKHHIHHLNTTTAAVWRHADGTHSVTDLARLAGQELGADVDEATVRLALTKLDDAGLLAESLAPDLRMSRMSRRSFMQRAGVAGAIAVPAIVSTTAAATAQSPTVCGEGCGARLNIFSFEFSFQNPCGVENSDCPSCTGELAFGDPCGGFGWVCFLGTCADSQIFLAANGSSGIPSQEQLQAYGEQVYADELSEAAEQPADAEFESSEGAGGDGTSSADTERAEVEGGGGDGTSDAGTEQAEVDESGNADVDGAESDGAGTDGAEESGTSELEGAESGGEPETSEDGQ